MALQIITADQRIADATVKGQIWGPAGIGKTTLLKTLQASTCLCVSAEGGLISVQRDDEFGPRYAGDTIEPRGWLEVGQITDGFCGPIDRPFASAAERPGPLQKYQTVFIDSTSVISNWCFAWAQTQPDAFSEKKTLANGNPAPDIRGAYGLLGREMTDWAWRWKNAPGINVWLVGGLSYSLEDGHTPLLMGQAAKNALPYIMDYVLVMDRLKAQDGNTYTGLFTSAIAFPQYATVPVKVRGGGFDAFERPHLGHFMAKALGRSSAPAAPPSVAA